MPGMARLNEASAPTEHIEALKRRFVRQNREIARVNSIQSLRIRSLESEVSHLLSENVSLREQVISLSQELERFEAVRLLQHGVYDIKTRLDSKLAELNNLVADLGALPRTFYSKRAENPRDSSQHRALPDWKSKTSDDELNHGTGEDGRLPVILEDKYYPRRTLEPQELQNIRYNTADNLRSPTPEEPVATQPDTADDSSSTNDSSDMMNAQQEPSHDEHISDEDEAVLPPTLETRKRKRPNLASKQMESPSMDHGATSTRNIPGAISGLGTKRKFSVHHEDTIEPLAKKSDLPRTSMQSPSPAGNNEQPLSSEADDSPSKGKASLLTEEAISHRLAKRKALEHRSTNMNVTSPTKAHNTMVQEKHQKDTLSSVDEKDGQVGLSPTPPKKSTDLEQSRQELTHGQCRIYQSTDEEKYSENTMVKAQPNTRSSTLPEIESGPRNLPEVSGPTRPARRQRAIVSYAEPNLRDKMRRPTKELIAAVGDHPRRSSSSLTTRLDSNEDEDVRKNGRSNGRRPRNSDSSGKEPRLPATEAAADSSTQQMNSVSQRKRKTSPASKCNMAPEGISESTGAYPHHWVAGSKVDEVMAEEGNCHTQPSQMVGNDVTRSVPPIGCKARPATARNSRRHSSQPESSRKGEIQPANNGYIGIESRDISPSEARAGNSYSTKSFEEFVKPSLPTQQPEASTGADLSTSKLADSGRTKRGQRAAAAMARRKSMML
ncbi:shugoshin family protein [Aspergillus vadensis CBS 113365]|uniref:Shugoshin C terminal domain protein n=1 Tax=Aspergillus vadensis (strain CBS 113365 / IMI 142717 / IBT 24658) TaxID=1448311 RepID=A0A319AX15_ASPVC|nr:shugoshin C terminal domain protein [Aspergillus vadensis CBS 113365]PYH64906.1 shugoshin C terminal domain protein [Aspergillus vadensis CBS 113365]